MILNYAANLRSPNAMVRHRSAQRKDEHSEALRPIDISNSCIAYKDDCHYDKPPSIAYVRSLEEEIQELKVQLRQAKTQVWLSRVGDQVPPWWHGEIDQV